MKNLIVFFISLILYNNMNAQSYQIKYEEKANIKNQLKNVTDEETRKRVTAHLSKSTLFDLYYLDGESLYIQTTAKSQENKELEVSGETTKKIEIGRDGGGIYKNHKSVSYLKEANILGKEFLVVDKLEKYTWEITNEEKVIGSYKCTKATTQVNGDIVEAWFTDIIAIPDGPADFFGLPGLIIELTTLKKTIHALEISENKSVKTIIKPSKGKQINRIEYQKILDQRINELKSGNGSSIGIK